MRFIQYLRILIPERNTEFDDVPRRHLNYVKYQTSS